MNHILNKFLAVHQKKTGKLHDVSFHLHDDISIILSQIDQCYSHEQVVEMYKIFKGDMVSTIFQDQLITGIGEPFLIIHL